MLQKGNQEVVFHCSLHTDVILNYDIIIEDGIVTKVMITPCKKCASESSVYVAMTDTIKSIIR